jgi:TMEM175 potassium channel family protein
MSATPGDRPINNETARVEAFSDGVFAIAITLLILEIHVPPSATTGGLRMALIHLWPSFLAFLASFFTIGIMWVNHHRLFTLIRTNDNGIMMLNLLLLLGISWIPFPTALLAEHLLGTDARTAGVLYAASFFFIAIVFNVMWRYAVRTKGVMDHVDVHGITRQYSLGPIMYGVLIGVAMLNGVACLVLSLLYALYFALPPALWRRRSYR